jgi:hypothetical protein
LTATLFNGGAIVKNLVLLVIVPYLLTVQAESQEINKEFVQRCLAGQAYWKEKLASQRTYSGSIVKTEPKGKANESFVIHFDCGRICIETYSVDHSKQNLIVRVFAKNYYFALSKANLLSNFVVDNVKEIKDERDERQALLSRWLYAERLIDAPSRAFDIPLEEIFEQQKWKIRSIQEITSPEQPDTNYRITANRVVDESYYDSVTFVVSPKFNYGVTSYEMTHRKDQGNVVSKIFGTIGYATREGQLPELSTVSITESGFEGNAKRTDLEFSCQCNFGHIEATCRDDVFTLPNYGISDPEGLTTGDRRISEYLLMAIFFIVFVACVYWYRNSR